jgi:hypothetical protein
VGRWERLIHAASALKNISARQAAVEQCGCTRFCWRVLILASHYSMYCANGERLHTDHL